MAGHLYSCVFFRGLRCRMPAGGGLKAHGPTQKVDHRAAHRTNISGLDLPHLAPGPIWALSLSRYGDPYMQGNCLAFFVGDYWRWRSSFCLAAVGNRQRFIGRDHHQFSRLPYFSGFCRYSRLSVLWRVNMLPGGYLPSFGSVGAIQAFWRRSSTLRTAEEVVNRDKYFPPGEHLDSLTGLSLIAGQFFLPPRRKFGG